MTTVAFLDLGHEEAYKDGYRYLRSLIDPLDQQQMALTCPQCPEWSLQDVLAHLMAVQELTANDGRPTWLKKRVIASLVNADATDRAAAGLERDTFWNDLVASLRPLSLTDLFVRWEAAMDRLSPEQWNVVDFAVHIGDIEEALGVSRSQNMAIHALSLERYCQLLTGHLEASAVPTVLLDGTGPDTLLGDTAAQHSVRGSTYEILRTVTGRRTLAEAERLLDWTTTPSETRAVFPIYDWLKDSRRNDRLF